MSTRDVALTLREGTSMAAEVSPDGRSIAIDLVGRLWILPARGGAAKPITPDLVEARQPAWSPDGRTIAFQGYDTDGAWHIFTVARDGTGLARLTSGVFDDREPIFSHDGRRLAFSSDRFGGITTIWTIEVEGGAPRRLSSRDGWMPAWSPNDREIAFVSSDAAGSIAGRKPAPGVWAADEGGHERLVQGARADGLPSAIAWSPDGRLLASVLGGEAAMRLRVDRRALTSDAEDVFPFRPQWLSSRDLLYTADGVIKRRSVLGGPPVTIPFTASVTLKRDTYPMARRELEPAGSQPVAGIVSPAVSPDGRFVAFTAVGDLWRLPVGGAAERLTDDPYVENDPAWSPDGRELAFTSDRDGRMNVWVRDLATGRDRQVTHLRGDNASGPAWSPDGAHIAFLINRTDLGTVAVRPGALAMDERSTPPGGRGELGRPTWSADSGSVAMGVLLPYSNRYREGLNQILVHRFDSGEWNASVIFPGRSAGNRQTEGPVWAPDGFHMAFVSGGRLWTVPTDAGGAATAPPTAIADEAADSPSWEGDSRHIVYLTPDGLRRVFADGGPPDRLPLEMAWRDAPTPGRIVVHAGRLFDGRTDGLEGPHDIVIAHGVIEEVTGHRADLHAGATVVDASAEVVMPGLIDMHAHLDPDDGTALGRIWLAYGVTSVRNPSVNPAVGLEMREAWDSGRRPGPRLFLSGQAFDGPRTFYPGYLPITSAAGLDRAIDTWSRFPLDFFKTYVRLPDAFQKRIVEYAHGTARMPVTSHELYPGVQYGVDGVEHLRGTSRRGYSPKVSTTNHSYQDVVDTIVESGMTLTPTIGIQGAFALRVARDPSMADDPRLKLLPPRVALALRDLTRATPERRAALAHALAPYGATLKAIVSGGGTLLAGTDAPIFPYGLSLHVELQAYVDAGLTPFQALQTATLNAARALGLDDRLGTIAPGRLADLTFLGGDPLSNIRETMDVKRVMKGGRLFNTADLVAGR